jgi:hypothetical protein
MKRLSLVLIISVMLQSALFADYAGDTESLVPEDAGIFIKTKKISYLLKTVNYVSSVLLDSEGKKAFNEKREEFRKKTGVDYLNGESLKRNGIDIERPVSFVSYGKDNNLDVMAFLVPVINEKDFPLKFVQIVRKIRGEGDADIYPVITDYNGSALYQIHKDIFITTIAGYAIIASTGDLVKKIIDRKGDSTGSLILNSDYSDYISKKKNSYDVNLFISRKFLADIIESASGAGIYAVIEDLEVEKEYLLAQSMKVDGESSLYEVSSTDSGLLESIGYAAAGLGFDANRLKVHTSVKLIRNGNYSELAAGIIKTGLIGSMLNVKESDASLFFSLDLKFLDEFCKAGSEECRQYNEMKQSFKAETGLDFSTEFLPHYSGIINIISAETGLTQGPGSFVVFLPMNSAAGSRSVWTKLKNVAKARNTAPGKFSEEKIDGADAFRFTDEKGNSNYVFYDTRGVYAGNNSDLIKQSLKGRYLKDEKDKERLGRIANDSTYFMLNIKKNNFLKSLAMMRTAGNPLYTGPLSKVGEIFIFCEKREDFYSLDLDVEFK